jgi:hypothetical protein
MVEMVVCNNLPLSSLSEDPFGAAGNTPGFTPPSYVADNSVSVDIVCAGQLDIPTTLYP